MTKQKKRGLFIGLGVLFAVALIFSVMVALFDRQAIGPQASIVGLAGINQAVWNYLGVSETWDLITDAIATLAILLVVLLFIVGLVQAVRRRSLWKIDPSLRFLFITYFLMIAVYAVFEFLAINYRPVLIDGALEASYPSSHVFLITTVLVTAGLELKILLKNSRLSKIIFVILIALAVLQIIGRQLAGVHWFSDIVGGVLFASVFIILYYINIKLLSE